MHTHGPRPTPASAPRPTRWSPRDLLTGVAAALGAMLTAATVGGAI